jgi:hypothetical protein
MNNCSAADYGRTAEAETTYQRALDGKEKASGVEHTSTLNTVNNLVGLYAEQDRMAEVEAKDGISPNSVVTDGQGWESLAFSHMSVKYCTYVDIRTRKS